MPVSTIMVFSVNLRNSTDSSKVVGGVRLDRVLVDNFSDTGSSERTDTLPAGFARFEHNLAEMPLMLYAGVGYTERFPDYWELFSPPTDLTEPKMRLIKSKLKTTQLDIGAHYVDKRTNAWISAYIGRVNDFILSVTIPTMHISVRSIISMPLSWEVKPVSAIN